MGATTQVRRTSAGATIGTSWTASVSDGSWDLIITASAGTVIELGASFVLNSPTTSTGYSYGDFATIVSGSVVNWVSTGTGSHTNGPYAFFQAIGNDYLPVSGSTFYTVQSGDISGGNVTFRFYQKRTAGTAPIDASSTSPAILWAAVCDYAPSSSSLTGTLSSTSWTALTGSVTITAAAGDVIEVTPEAIVNPPASGFSIVQLDAATMVSASPVNWLSTGNGSHTGGVGGWRCQLSDYEPATSSVLYVVQSGDVSSGQVTVKIYGTCNTGSRALDSASKFTVKKV